MWRTQIETILPDQVLKMRFFVQEHPLTMAALIDLWANDQDFRSFFLMQLETIPFQTYRWEWPPLQRGHNAQGAECVFVNAPGLALHPDRETFRDQFAKATHGISVFTSLGKDAVLLAPCPLDSHPDYPHLAAFLRNAPNWQKHALFEQLAKAIQSIQTYPCWLSTAGGGVSWLHVRLDQRPKYYHYRPYTRLI